MLRESSAVQAAARVASRVWRLPLWLAAGLMVGAGVAEATGHHSVVLYATLLAVGLAAVAVPVGLLALLTEESS